MIQLLRWQPSQVCKHLLIQSGWFANICACRPQSIYLMIRDHYLNAIDRGHMRYDLVQTSVPGTSLFKRIWTHQNVTCQYLSMNEGLLLSKNRLKDTEKGNEVTTSKLFANFSTEQLVSLATGVHELCFKPCKADSQSYSPRLPVGPRHLKPSPEVAIPCP